MDSKQHGNKEKQTSSPSHWSSGSVSALELVGCGFNPWLGQSNTVKMVPITSLLRTKYSGLELGGWITQ